MESLRGRQETEAPLTDDEINPDGGDPFEPIGPDPTPEEWEEWGRLNREYLARYEPDAPPRPVEPSAFGFDEEDIAAADAAQDKWLMRKFGRIR